MADIFEIKLSLIKEDNINDDNRKRISTINIPKNDSLNELKVQLPITYEGPKGENTLEKFYTPEHLFISGISGCFFTTFNVVSTNSNMKYKKFQIEAKGIIDVSTRVKIMEKIEQTITLTVPPNINKKKALNVLELTEKRCPLANSVKTKIENKYIIIKESNIPFKTDNIDN